MRGRQWLRAFLRGPLTRRASRVDPGSSPGQARSPQAGSGKRRQVDQSTRAVYLLFSMQMTVTTWNINSVRLRIDAVAKFLKAVRPNVLCLQETKCPDDKFPLKRFARLGYTHVDLNVAPLEHDVWSHRQMIRVVSHTPIECEKLVAAQRAGNWIDAMRAFVPEPAKLYTWWSYRAPDWAAADKGRRLDHIWVAPELGDRVAAIRVTKQSRGWARPSDHVPVTATVEV